MECYFPSLFLCFLITEQQIKRLGNLSQILLNVLATSQCDQNQYGLVVGCMVFIDLAMESLV